MELPRADFILLAVAAGIITGEDGLAAAKGDIPPSLASLIDSLTPEQQMAASIRWGAATKINRMDPLIVAFAQYLGLNAILVDDLFIAQGQPHHGI